MIAFLSYRFHSTASNDSHKTAHTGQPDEEAQRPLTQEELAFLSAALEIIETSSLVEHALIWVLISLFLIAVVGKLNEVAVANGKVIPFGYTRTVVTSNGGLQFEVWAQNQDIGFLDEGQQTEMKVEAFNFQKWVGGRRR